MAENQEGKRMGSSANRYNGSTVTRMESAERNVASLPNWRSETKTTAVCISLSAYNLLHRKKVYRNCKSESNVIQRLLGIGMRYFWIRTG
jgi:hypothetical protein